MAQIDSPSRPCPPPAKGERSKNPVSHASTVST